DLEEAVAEPGVLEAQTHTARPARRLRSLVGGPHRFEAATGAQAAVVHDLARAPEVTWHHDVEVADRPATETDRFGQPVERAFHRELRLVGTEPSERTAHRVVGARRDRLDVDCPHAVRAAGVPSRPSEN